MFAKRPFGGRDGHMESSNRAVKTACDIQVDGKCGPKRLKMAWKQLTELPGRGPTDVDVATVPAR